MGRAADIVLSAEHEGDPVVEELTFWMGTFVKPAMSSPTGGSLRSGAHSPDLGPVDGHLT
jgi:hypothetical protein